MLLGCDFSSAPTRRKPIVLAFGQVDGDVVRLTSLEYFESLEAWQHRLQHIPRWIGAFDFPFGLPRELIVHLDWPLHWMECMAFYAGLSRAEIRSTFKAFCDGRPSGSKFAHRATDGPAASSPSMKWVNPPVAFMLHAGMPRLLAAGAAFPGLHVPSSDPPRVALEGYPGLLARELVGRRSYKSDKPETDKALRAAVRKELMAELEHGSTRLDLRLSLEGALRDDLLADAKGDRIDAVLCLMQCAWGARRKVSPGPGFGLPDQIDPLEGWIVSA
ncbi:MAG: DUF429 domain-containing protein [Gammaproteobacteria bacterium]|nr:DUF429 domain-containing protein [Gammaproteobacteria bacterium]MBU1440488.1 DUF429 domain-containing protein [Gammaproteobacteria bacterium]MBU2286592.1 DUF429 domain-containing protein [Gammaproteobacteria bacterium]MBU2410309.1 DUF429 domain-containing protein [Gammaproteobacteria bacterium]